MTCANSLCVYLLYVTKSSEAAQLSKDHYFHVAGESAYTRIFEPRYGRTFFGCLKKRETIEHANKNAGQQQYLKRPFDPQNRSQWPVLTADNKMTNQTELKDQVVRLDKNDTECPITVEIVGRKAATCWNVLSYNTHRKPNVPKNRKSQKWQGKTSAWWQVKKSWSNQECVPWWSWPLRCEWESLVMGVDLVLLDLVFDWISFGGLHFAHCY